MNMPASLPETGGFLISFSFASRVVASSTVDRNFPRVEADGLQIRLGRILGEWWLIFGAAPRVAN